MAARKSSGKRKYGDKASEKVEKAMHEKKRGTLRSGGSGKKVTSRKQAIAIGLSEARRAVGRSRRAARPGRSRPRRMEPPYRMPDPDPHPSPAPAPSGGSEPHVPMPDPRPLPSPVGVPHPEPDVPPVGVPSPAPHPGIF